jgi:hypothetical protein
VTTLTIDDELSRQACAAAAAQGKSLDEFVREVLQDAVRSPVIRRKSRNGLPVVMVCPPTPIESQAVADALGEEGF